jgi:hypothetical protein
MTRPIRAIQARAPLALLASAFLLLAACSSGTGSASTASTSTTGAQPGGTAKVLSIDVPATVSCNGATSTTVQVSYSVEGASRQELRVDGRPVPGTDQPTGTVTAPVHCDALPHTIVVIAYDAKGRFNSKQKLVTTS